MFPTERKHSYEVPYSKNKDRKILARGKLKEKFGQVKERLIEQGLIQAEVEKPEEENTNAMDVSQSEGDPLSRFIFIILLCTQEKNTSL